MYCRKCGEKLKDDALFCEMCGTRISTENEMEENDKQNLVAPASDEQKMNENMEASFETTENTQSNAVFDETADDAAYAYAAEIPGQAQATGSLILGILSISGWFFGYTAILSFILGIIGIAQASKSKNLGFTGGTRTAGFVLSILGLVGGAIILCAAFLAVGLFSSLSGILSGLDF